MRLDDGLGDRRASPKPSSFIAAALPPRRKRSKMPSSSSGGYADAAIRTRTLTSPLGAADLDLYGSLGFGVPHRIIKKHEEKLP